MKIPIWSVKIDNVSGDVKVHLTERDHDQALKDGTTHVFFFPKETILRFIFTNCKPNVFYQCNLEGRLEDLRHERIESLYRKTDRLITGQSGTADDFDLCPAWTKEIKELALWHAMNEVFRSSGAYDNYYGGGTFKRPGFNLMKYLRTGDGTP